MFHTFRRNSKASATLSGRQSTVATRCSTTSNSSARPTTHFFSLPAELRNYIWSLTADGVVLRLVDRKQGKLAYPRKKRPADAVPSLLVTSRQCRAEYLPLLLATARIEVQVVDFDFSSLMRTIGSLYCSELKSLRLNPNLMLALSFTPHSSEKLACMESHLRRWTVNRRAGLDRLPWRYRLGAHSTSSVFVVSYRRCMAVLKLVHGRIEESLQWELQRIMDVVEVPLSSQGQFRADYHEFERGRLWDTAVAQM